MPTIGFIYPDHAAEDDYPLAERLLGDGTALPVAHIYGTDLHAVPELLDLGSPARLADGAAKLADKTAELGEHGPEAVVWACTSGSFVYGWDGAAQQVAGLSEAAGGRPASSTSLAFVHAAQTLGVRKVAVAASYPDEVASLFVEFLRRGGIDVVSMAAADIDTAAEVGELAPEKVVDLALAHDHAEADALLVPDTAMRTLALVDELEHRLGKPVLTANQVTVWEGLRIAGVSRTYDEMGALLRAEGSR